MHSAQVTEIIKSFQKFWSLEDIGIKRDEDSDVNFAERRAQQLQDELTHFDPATKTWSTGLLFKEYPPNLGPNKRKAIAILKKTESSAIGKKQVEIVNEAYSDFVTNQFAEEVI